MVGIKAVILIIHELVNKSRSYTERKIPFKSFPFQYATPGFFHLVFQVGSVSIGYNWWNIPVIIIIPDLSRQVILFPDPKEQFFSNSISPVGCIPLLLDLIIIIVIGKIILGNAIIHFGNRLKSTCPGREIQIGIICIETSYCWGNQKVKAVIPVGIANKVDYTSKRTTGSWDTSSPVKNLNAIKLRYWYLRKISLAKHRGVYIDPVPLDLGMVGRSSPERCCRKSPVAI